MFDNGNKFDWSKTSQDYSKYRDIYPEKMYDILYAFGVGTKF